MQFRFVHNNLNVLHLEESIAFYQEALNLEEQKRYESPDGSFKLIYLGDKQSDHLLELTWLRDHLEPYNLGENEFHIAFVCDDFTAAYERHKRMGCICYENKEMGIYFIQDPDGYWIEILPAVKE